MSRIVSGGQVVGGGWMASIGVAAALTTAGSAGAEPPAGSSHAHEPSSVFIIAKNHNKNQVHYGVRVDATCNVVGAQPLYAYWRMFEHRGEVEPLLPTEISVYGVDAAQQVERTAQATRITARLNAVPGRTLIITVEKVSGRCEARARTSIAGTEANLRWVYVRFVWPLGVDYVLLHGARVTDDSVVEERLSGG